MYEGQIINVRRAHKPELGSLGNLFKIELVFFQCILVNCFVQICCLPFRVRCFAMSAHKKLCNFSTTDPLSFFTSSDDDAYSIPLSSVVEL